jgi:hypothetical protein
MGIAWWFDILPGLSFQFYELLGGVDAVARCRCFYASCILISQLTVVRLPWLPVGPERIRKLDNYGNSASLPGSDMCLMWAERQILEDGPIRLREIRPSFGVISYQVTSGYRDMEERVHDMKEWAR